MVCCRGLMWPASSWRWATNAKAWRGNLRPSSSQWGPPLSVVDKSMWTRPGKQALVRTIDGVLAPHIVLEDAEPTGQEVRDARVLAFSDVWMRPRFY